MSFLISKCFLLLSIVFQFFVMATLIIAFVVSLLKELSLSANGLGVNRLFTWAFNHFRLWQQWEPGTPEPRSLRHSATRYLLSFQADAAPLSSCAFHVLGWAWNQLTYSAGLPCSINSDGTRVLGSGSGCTHCCEDSIASSCTCLCTHPLTDVHVYIFPSLLYL